MNEHERREAVKKAREAKPYEQRQVEALENIQDVLMQINMQLASLGLVLKSRIQS